LNRASQNSKDTASTTAGVACGPGSGKFVFRIRQTHVAQHYGPLIAKKRYGTVKLDLVLRMIALSPQHAGERAPGYVLWNWSYEDLYDLSHTTPASRSVKQRSNRQTRHLKRKWVIDHLNQLRALDLVQTKRRDGSRPEILVLRDDASGQPFDDPAGDARDDWYVTIHGSLIAAGVVARWGAPELAAYFAALIAEFYNERGDRPLPTAGTGRWWRSLAWFGHPTYQPAQRVRLPFSTSLLEDGLKALEAARLITSRKIMVHPLTNRKLDAPRKLYRNRFTIFDTNVEKVARLEAGTS
jgi:hypothetical protein